MGAIYFFHRYRHGSRVAGRPPLETFVETGTFEGASVLAVRPFFKRIFTVELSEDLHGAATEKFRGDAAVEVLPGNSPAALETLRPRLEKESVLYWLDAHWCGPAVTATAGEKSQCPLLLELDAIRVLNENSVILIDDARLFLSIPPAPLNASNWPDFDAIVRKLFTLGPAHMLAVINDVIAYVPRGAFPALREYARDHSPDLLAELAKAKEYDALKKDRDELAASVDLLTQSQKQTETDREARLETIQR